MRLVFFVCAVVAVFLVDVDAQVCCDGNYSSGPCVNDICLTGQMCTNNMCCTCRDTCCDCYLYVGYCNNPYYANVMDGCQYTCGKCQL